MAYAFVGLTTRYDSIEAKISSQYNLLWDMDNVVQNNNA